MKSKIGLVIPCYNEADRLDIDSFESFAKDNKDFILIFANDGSTDNTNSILLSLSKKNPDNIFCFIQDENMGKAEIIRGAILEYYNKVDYIGYLDADLATPLSEFKTMCNIITENAQCQIIMGCRHKRMGVQIERNIIRHYLGRIFSTLASITLQISVYDTQCGAKILKSTLVYEIFKKPFLSKWFFDVEILKRLLLIRDINLNLYTIVEYPLNAWKGIEGSKVKFRDFLVTPFELIKIHIHYPRLSKTKLEALSKLKLISGS